MDTHIDLIVSVIETANEAHEDGDLSEAYQGREASLLGKLIANEIETGIDLDLCEDEDDARSAACDALQGVIDRIMKVQGALQR